MTVPALGGLLWAAYGYRGLLAAAMVAMVNGAVATRSHAAAFDARIAGKKRRSCGGRLSARKVRRAGEITTGGVGRHARGEDCQDNHRPHGKCRS